MRREKFGRVVIIEGKSSRAAAERICGEIRTPAKNSCLEMRVAIAAIPQRAQRPLEVGHVNDQRRAVHAERLFEAQVSSLAAEIARSRLIDDRRRARVMAMGELFATALGCAFLNEQRIPTRWIDARTVLRAEQRAGSNLKASFLSATCDFAPDRTLMAAWRAID